MWKGREDGVAIPLFIQWSAFQLLSQFGFPSHSCFYCSWAKIIFGVLLYSSGISLLLHSICVFWAAMTYFFSICQHSFIFLIFSRNLLESFSRLFFLLFSSPYELIPLQLYIGISRGKG